MRQLFPNASGADKGVEATIKSLLFHSLCEVFGCKNVFSEVEPKNSTFIKDMIVVHHGAVCFMIEVKAYRNWCSKDYDKDFYSIRDRGEFHNSIGCFIQYSFVEKPSQIKHIREKLTELEAKCRSVRCATITRSSIVDGIDGNISSSPCAIVVCCD